MPNKWKSVIHGVVLALSLASCGQGSDKAATATEASPGVDNTEEVLAYYASRPDFFSFKTPADIPPDLVWENGMELPEIGSPNARKGGTQYSFLSDFPRTLRVLGPDANGGFRPFIQDDVAMSFAHRHGNEFAYFPGLASEWAVDRDKQRVYVRIDPAARWSDGVPVTSDDVLFMFFMYQSAYISEPWYNNWYGTRYTNITRYDEHTFSIDVTSAKPDMDSLVLELRPMPQHFYRELGDDFVDRYQWRFQPTTGAYVVKEEDIKKGRSIALTRLQDWWARDKKFWRYRFNPDKIHFSVIRDSSKSFEAFRRGDIDAFGLNLAENWYEKLPDSDPDVEAGYIRKAVFYNQFPRSPIGLWINSSRPLLDNRDIRVGINYATNWSLVIEKYFRGDYTRMQTASDGFGEFSHPTLKARPFDINKAREYFAAAGFTTSGPDGVLVNEQGQRLSFTLSSGYESMKDVLTILKEEALKAGLELRIEVLDGTAAWKMVQEKKHDIQYTGFGGFLEMYPRYWEHYHSDNAYDEPYLADGSVNPDRKIKTQTNNLEELAIPEMDSLIEAYRTSSDKAEMIQLAHQMDELHAEYASFVPGFVQDFYRVGYWRWFRYPEDFNLRHSNYSGEFFVHWIDEDMRRETLEARKRGETFAPEIRVYDQYKSR
jgi:microcin C transport system substrate-binding protein